MDLSDSFSTYVPELEFNKDPGITDDILLHHLISHQAALADNTPVNGGAADSILETYALDVYAKYYFTMAPPGAMFNYSNPNFGFAGLALERASGRSYREEVVEEVFKPLGMDRSFFLGEEVLADGNYATARTLNYWSGLIPKEETVGPDSYDDAFSRPAGFAWASVGDLLRFADFAMNGNTDLMSLERSSELMTRQVNTHQFLDVDHYGYGWMIWDGTYTLEGEWLPATIARHNGVIPGYSADLYAVPDHDFAVAILANSDGAYLGESFMTALDIVLGEVLPATTTDPLSLVDPVPLETYEGTYFDAQNVGEIVVTMEGDALKAHIPTLDSIGYPYDPTLIYISPGNFWQVLDGFGTLVTFVPSGEADSAYFRTRYYVGTSTELAEPDSAAAPNPTRFMKALRHPLTPSASNFLYQENYMLGSVVH
jgi:CubicO group peptidase (beta-lactamase class C family)